jgi:hypothetical protein
MSTRKGFLAGNLVDQSLICLPIARLAQGKLVDAILPGGVLLDPNGPRLFLVGLRKPFKRMAGTTGLEPAASAVTGQRSNQLNYVPNLFS